MTTNGCRCSNTWDYAGTRYHGTCRTGLVGSTTVPGIDVDTNWCFVDKYCPKGKRLDGFTYDLCTPAGGRTTEDGAACQFPASYHGVMLYDCISYNHTSGGATPKRWCFTNVATGAWGYCAPWTCAAALKVNCPAGNPTDNLAGWASPACLETLCNARKDLANISLCTQDSQADKDRLTGAFSDLSSSNGFGQLLSSTTGSGKTQQVKFAPCTSLHGASIMHIMKSPRSTTLVWMSSFLCICSVSCLTPHADSLGSYCSKEFGYLCMDSILDLACPGLFRQDNTWMASTSKTLLCDAGCVKALCRLQEQAKTSVTGAPKTLTARACPESAAVAAALAMLPPPTKHAIMLTPHNSHV